MIRQLTFEYSASTGLTLGSEGCAPGARATWVFIDVSGVDVDERENCHQLLETLSTTLCARVRIAGPPPAGAARLQARPVQSIARHRPSRRSRSSATRLFGYESDRLGPRRRRQHQP